MSIAKCKEDSVIVCLLQPSHYHRFFWNLNSREWASCYFGFLLFFNTTLSERFCCPSLSACLLDLFMLVRSDYIPLYGVSKQ